jgi:hypothetical protein
MEGQDYQVGDTCQQCGACCAYFRVSFYWAESPELGLPEDSVERVAPLLACMAGTNQPTPRCRSLEGKVGETVHCRVYSQRPSPCRELQRGDARCNRARASHGLAPVLVI